MKIEAKALVAVLEERDRLRDKLARASRLLERVAAVGCVAYSHECSPKCLFCEAGELLEDLLRPTKQCGEVSP